MAEHEELSVMLVLSRKEGQSIILRHQDAEILVKLIDIIGDKAHIGIEAPLSVVITRTEIDGRRQ